MAGTPLSPLHPAVGRGGAQGSVQVFFFLLASGSVPGLSWRRLQGQRLRLLTVLLLLSLLLPLLIPPVVADLIDDDNQSVNTVKINNDIAGSTVLSGLPTVSGGAATTTAAATATITTTSPTATTASPAIFSSLPGCPAWIPEYVSFHRANRLAPGAKYLLHTCYGAFCGGVGDRLRGVLWSARLAALHRRVLLVSWSRPTELTHFMAPAAIDWTMEGLPDSVQAQGTGGGGGDGLGSWQRLTWLDAGPSEATLRQLQPEAGVWQLEHNTLEDQPVPGTEEGGREAPELASWGNDAACLFQALFRPTDLVRNAVDAELVQLYGSAEAPYSAMHIRIGGLQGEGEAAIGIKRMSKLTYFLESLDCLRHLSGTGPGGAPAPGSAASAGARGLRPAQLVVSDSNTLRSKVQGGLLPGLVAPSYSAAHLDTVHDSDVALHATTFVSLGLLARATCAVYTDSGFSRVAFYMGTQTCVAVMARHESSLPMFARLQELHQQATAAAAAASLRPPVQVCEAAQQMLAQGRLARHRHHHRQLSAERL